jgi:N-acetylmuramoyl-L-alanine amidase
LSALDGYAEASTATKTTKTTKTVTTAKTSKPAAATATAVTPAKKATATTTSNKPVFKIQILASDTKLKSNDKRLKGLKADYYKENGMYKYTYGESTDYNKIATMRKSISTKFKEAFVVAFLNGEKINTKTAIELYKKGK